MKRLFLTLTTVLCVLAVTAATEVTYIINATNAPVGGGTLETNGVTVTVTSGTTTFASGTGGTIKYSKGKSYTVTLPTSANVTKIKFYGYGNQDNTDTYLASCAGQTFEANKYVFASRTTLKSEPYDTHELTFATPLTGGFNFTFNGAQACIVMTLTSMEETSQGGGDNPSKPDPSDAYSLGKYASPSTGEGVVPTGATKVFSYPTPSTMMEKLTRGVVVLPEMNGKGNVVTWRLFGTDTKATTFNVLKNGKAIATGLDKVTNYTDAEGTPADEYSIETVVDGTVTETSDAVKAWNRIYKTLKLDRPSDTRSLGCEYTPNDMSAADLDGDGEYELIVKWNPTNSRDNSQAGITGTVYLDAYKLDGTKMWHVDLGQNIRAGAHYSPFLAYDFDGDGKAEMICKTAPNTIDGAGKSVTLAGDATIRAVSSNKKCYNSNGHIITGEEFLTVFNGETGAAMNTIWYNPPRSGVINATGSTSYGNWEKVVSKSTNYNRGERYNAAVAYLNGTNGKPSAILQRGYYTYAFLWAVDWDGTNLSTRWIHYGDSKSTWKTYDATGKETASGSGKSSFGQGVHGISVGDVNNDGYDEIVIGSATIGHDGKLLCSTGKGHGDAIHLGDLCPDRDGLEIMMPHEESPYGYDVHDAATGELIYNATSSGDNGRGVAADVLASNRGYEFWSSADGSVRSCVDGSVIGTKTPSKNFRIYWDGDLQDELFDGHHSTSTSDQLAMTELNGSCAAAIEKLKTTTSYSTLLSLSSAAYGNGQTCNITKGTPCIQADLFGDWREELVLWDKSDPSVVNIYSSNVPSAYRVPTLMHDHVYRMGIAWQNSSYNQPPHLGYYLPDMFDKNYGIYSEAYESGIQIIENNSEAGGGTSSKCYSLSGQRISSPKAGTIYIINGKKVLK